MKFKRDGSKLVKIKVRHPHEDSYHHSHKEHCPQHQVQLGMVLSWARAVELDVGPHVVTVERIKPHTFATQEEHHPRPAHAHAHAPHLPLDVDGNTGRRHEGRRAGDKVVEVGVSGDGVPVEAGRLTHAACESL